MSINRRAAKRDISEKSIIEALQAAGCTVVQISKRGVADLLVGYHGQNYLMEVKTGKAKLTMAENIFHLDWQGQVTIVRSVEEALQAIGR